MLDAVDNNSTTGTFMKPTIPNSNGSYKWTTTKFQPYEIKRRRRTSENEFNVLMNAYNENPKPNTITRHNLAKKLNMKPRMVQVWFQNRRAKSKAKQKKAQKKISTANYSYKCENNSSENTNGLLSHEPTSECTDCNKKRKSESLTDETTSTVNELNGDLNDSVNENNNTLLDKDNSLITNNCFKVVNDPNQKSMSLPDIPLPDTSLPDNSLSDTPQNCYFVRQEFPVNPQKYYINRQDIALNQDPGSSSLYLNLSHDASLNGRCRSKSLPNLNNINISPQQQQQLVNSLTQPFLIQDLHQQQQLPIQVQPYSSMELQKPEIENYSYQNFELLNHNSPFSSNTLLLTQNTEPLLSTGLANDSNISPSSDSSKNISEINLSSELVKHPDNIFTEANDNLGTSIMVTPGIMSNIPGPYLSTSENQSINYQNLMPNITSIDGARTIDHSFGYIQNSCSFTQQTINNIYANSTQNFFPDLNVLYANINTLQDISFPLSEFGAYRRSSCPPELLKSVNSYIQPSQNDNLSK